MATSNNTIEITAEEMLAYRDELVRALNRSSDLLNQEGEKDLHKKIQENIQEESHKLKHLEVILSVVGTAKAGKSTTINAIVGREIMPNRNLPMTTLPTLIYHTPKQIEPKLSFVAEPANHFVGQLKTVFKEQPECLDMTELSKTDMQAIIQKIRKGQCRFEPEYKGEKEIFDFLKQLNDLVRLAGFLPRVNFPFDEYNHIDKLPKIEVEFAHLANTDSTNGRLVLLDTPGPNEAGQDDLSDVLETQLKRSSVILLVVDYAQIGTTAGEEVQKIIAKLPTLKAERLFILLNQIDRENSNSNTLEEIVQDFEKITFTNEKKQVVKVKAENIFPISALYAYLANRLLKELSHCGKPEYQKNTWVGDFVKIAFGPSMNSEKWGKTAPEDIEQVAKILLNDSRFETLQNQLIVNMHQNAASIAMNNALDFCETKLKEEFENFHESWTKTLEKSEDEIHKLNQTIAECRKDTEKLSDVKNKVQKQVHDIRDTAKREIEQHKKTVQSQTQQWINKFAKGQITELEREIADLREELPTFVEDIFAPFKNADKKNRLYRLQEKLQATDDYIVFDYEEEADEFFNTAVEQYFTFVESAYSTLKQSVDTQIEKITQQLDCTENEVQTVVNQVLQRLTKEKINLQLSIPKAGDFTPLKQRKLDKMGVIKKEKHTYWVDSDGILASVKRGVGVVFGQKTWGREKRTETLHKFSKVELRQKLNTAWQRDSDFFNQETERKLNTFGDEWVENYIGTVREKIEQVLGKIKTAIAVANGDKAEKEKKQKQIANLYEQYQEINQDIAMVRDNVCPELK